MNSLRASRSALAAARSSARPLVRPSQLVQRYASSSTPAVSVSEEKDPQLNGYPELPPISKQSLPALGWWDMQYRRNYGDTLHEREELFSVWGPDVPPIEPRKALFHFSIAVLAFIGIAITANALVPEKQFVERTFPFDGLVTELGGMEENKARPETVDIED